MRRRTVTTALAAALTTSAATPAIAAPPPSAPSRPGRGPRRGQDRAPQLLHDGVGLYPRVLRLTRQDDPTERLLASIVTFEGPSGSGAIWESTDGGASFTQVGSVFDDATAGGEGLCCATLFELPRAVGEMPAGTLLWAASVGQDRPERRMSIRIWASTDVGRSWEQIAISHVAENEGGLWEPEFAVADDGTLVMWFCDETDGENHSQKIVQQTSTNGLTWTDPEPVIELEDPSARPGMPNVRRLRTGAWAMSYEVCGPKDFCRTFVRTTDDPRHWGDPTARDAVIRAADGTEPRHTPTLLVDEDGSVLLGSQMHYMDDGGLSPLNGQVVLRTNSRSLQGRIRWVTEPAPVPVEDPWDNYCPNYSPTFVRTKTGHLLEITTAPGEDELCRAWFGSLG
ncbi:sialidase family protein [Brachybacterium sp. UMB0905]|uniref:sialidase family protein n=1 Tax=Brachybacterium sp. UMB0905 TaxID=2069310 RepID=UPI000C7FD71B|nr:sialidase family protein [Brachybacterium sp. UMB0905]PMC74512.1 exo-alpha-sialidase [Brachybacterium sp. UMB0905]